MLRLAQYCVVLLFVGCSIIPYKPEPVPPNATLEKACKLACINLSRLGCEGFTTNVESDEEEGNSGIDLCADTCFNMEAGTPSFPFYPRCRAVATNCDEITQEYCEKYGK
jgi:hypothetical protein